MSVDYRYKVSVPVRDFAMCSLDNVAFVVDVYGVLPSDLCTVGGAIGSRPMQKAIQRLGLSNSRFKSFLWDIPV